jgi:hypothetical protein
MVCWTLKDAERYSGTELFTIRHGVMVLHRIQAQDSVATLAMSFRIAKSHMPEHMNLYGKKSRVTLSNTSDCTIRHF